MLPTVNELLNANIEIFEQTSNTFFLDADRNIVFGFTDGREAMKQAIYLILSVERYKYIILPWNYGVEFDDLFGMPVSWVIPEAKRRIQEALLQDNRIISVEDFDFTTNKSKLTIGFTAKTIHGDIDIVHEVIFSV